MRRYGRILGGAVSAVVALSACGGQPFSKAVGPEAVRAHLVSAATRTVEAKTARIAMTVNISGVGGVSGFKETGSGVIDFNSGALDLTASFDAGGSNAKLEARRIGKKLYVRTSGYPGAADAWETVDLSRVEGSDAAVNAQFEPVEFLSYLEGVADDVHVVGTEKVRGDNTMHYSASVTLERALANTSLSAEQRQALQKDKKVFTGTMPTEAWIDDVGRLRKLTMTLHENADLVEGVSAPTVAITMEYYDFGTAVMVSEPSNSSDVQARAQDRATQSDLRNALTAEKTYYTDSQAYTDDTQQLNYIESSLDWGGKLKVFVGDAIDTGDNTVVCIEETSESATTFVIADVAEGPYAGTYFGRGDVSCPDNPAASDAYSFGTSWGVTTSSASAGGESACSKFSGSVGTAVRAYRQAAGDPSLRPTLGQLKAFRYLQHVPPGMTLTYEHDGSVSVSCS
jgi:type II secretory pathway pseudopilin PulG